ncbi:MAG: NifB/NifX family molybdenum-iron cluster-binding protein [candidate division NC10 bacterium]|nr:NifB/NifX family molybdenum-iron cluster-binding protein [candidate division NC10 bacterium]
MRVAIPFWNDRVSPVFDAARRLVVVDVENGVEQTRHHETLQEEFPTRRARQLAQLGVNVLICGAISRPLVALLAGSGITLIPWTAGPVDEVLAAYLAGGLPDARWMMPGCGGRRQRHRGSRGPCGWDTG